ncbi:hypothetical protein F2Q70_00027576 [Brassica cretica]|uniref:Uncharacterized protein n=1 Tax=Brassica cretica TaxID=69181 RepID=A0A8S9LCJ2_BRACR|nr:hypothetical protein F2Q70_00027576 [Brassica cretica]
MSDDLGVRRKIRRNSVCFLVVMVRKVDTSHLFIGEIDLEHFCGSCAVLGDCFVLERYKNASKRRCGRGE